MIKDHHCICSRHFPNAGARNDPQLNTGKRFASPKKQWTWRITSKKSQLESRSNNSSILSFWKPDTITKIGAIHINNWCSFPLCFPDSALCIPGKSNMLRGSSYFQPKIFCYLSISCRFLQDDGSFILQHNSHHFSAVTLSTSKGSFSKTPGIPASLSATVTWGSLSCSMLPWSAGMFKSLSGKFGWQVRVVGGNNALCWKSTSTSRFSTTKFNDTIVLSRQGCDMCA